MHRLITSTLIAVVLPVTAVSAAPWEVPMIDTTPGGVDHIQIRLAPTYKFAAPATKAFGAFDEQGEFDFFRAATWDSTFLNDNKNFTVANGQAGNGTLAYTLMMDGNQSTDRPSFHYQSYRNGARVGNYDFYNVSNTGNF